MSKSPSFNFENNLPHQLNAIADIQAAFKGAQAQAQTLSHAEINPHVLVDNYKSNIDNIQINNAIPAVLRRNSYKNILDIEMETGTGKTYTYTQTMFVLNREFGVHKFVVFVPTLAIKAGTKAFFAQSRQRFLQDFGKSICLYEVNAQKGSNNKKQHTPSALLDFVRSADTRHIHVLLINAGMLNSKNMALPIEQDLFGDVMGNAFAAVAAVKPFCIVDEPHKIKQANKTWGKLAQFKPQYILRFGATFDGAYENLIHRLTALDAFSQNLVKGVRTFVLDFPQAKDIRIQFKGQTTSQAEAVFAVSSKNSDKIIRKTLAKNEDLGALHQEMQGVKLDNFLASRVEFSNGLVLAKNETISPYSFSQSLQTDMLQKAIETHFKLERDLLTRKNTPKIKPLTLIFIDDIEGYRGEKSAAPESLKNRFEALVKATAQTLLKNETDSFYRDYLQKTLDAIGNTHGGYFSQDNSDKDEKIEAEINEILHDKAALLSLDNPRRFIFSKWTLREGWDNPNVFQICKLRSSGSETSKLQEVGRGLRLPVNEFMNREKQEQFYLNYFVDFSERDFVDKLIGEIAEQSNMGEAAPDSLTLELKEKIRAKYPDESNRSIADSLYQAGAIDDNDAFTANGFAQMIQTYPLAFPIPAHTQLGSKIANADAAPKHSASIRHAKYQELKTLWEAINRRVILQYKVKDEQAFVDLLDDFFRQLLNQGNAKQSATIDEATIKVVDGAITYTTGSSTALQHTALATLSYADFSQKLAQALSVNLASLHHVLAKLAVDFTNLQNNQGIRSIATAFKHYLLHNCLHKHQVAYQAVQSAVHPTAFTHSDGTPKAEIAAANIGRQGGEKSGNDNYLFDAVFFDSDLERKNILAELEEVIVFTKIPKNTINIPVAGGGTYSPDFAYVLKHKNGEQTLNLVVETKDADSAALRAEEKQKIRYAEILFNPVKTNAKTKVQFKTQFETDKIEEIIKKLCEN